jgi:hypothetical protein
VSRLSRENVGASTCHNPMGLHSLLQGWFIFFFYRKPEIMFWVRGIISPNKQNRVPYLIIRWHPTYHRPVEKTGSNHNPTKWRTYSRWILIQKVWLNYERNAFSSAQHSLISCSLVSLNIPEENVDISSEGFIWSKQCKIEFWYRVSFCLRAL